MVALLYRSWNLGTGRLSNLYTANNDQDQNSNPIILLCVSVYERKKNSPCFYGLFVLVYLASDKSICGGYQKKWPGHWPQYLLNQESRHGCTEKRRGPGFGDQQSQVQILALLLLWTWGKSFFFLFCEMEIIMLIPWGCFEDQMKSHIQKYSV